MGEYSVRRMAGKPVVRWTVALGWSVPAIYFLVWPSRGTPVGKLFVFLGGTGLTAAVGHLILCGSLVWLWYWALRALCRPIRALGIVVGIGLGLGIVTELVQLLIPSRGASLLDLLANILGVGLAAGAARRLDD
ncbi:MAG: VanZ family protein [Anaerolineae bacterium]|nr:VanZ family protein [Anaerolineae bacterium]